MNFLLDLLFDVDICLLDHWQVGTVGYANGGLVVLLFDDWLVFIRARRMPILFAVIFFFILAIATIVFVFLVVHVVIGIVVILVVVVVFRVIIIVPRIVIAAVTAEFLRK